MLDVLWRACCDRPRYIAPHNKLAIMETRDWAAVALALVMGIVFMLDRRIRRKAKSVRTSWNCIRCGVELGPMQSANIRVAGGPYGATMARACLPCAARDRRIWWSVMTAVVVAIFGTISLLLWLK